MKTDLPTDKDASHASALTEGSAKGESRKPTLDGAPPPLAYQPQHFWSDGDFDMWGNIGVPTISKRITRERLSLYLGLHPGEKVRVLKIVSSAEVIDATEFLPNEKDQGRAKRVL